MSGFHGYTRDEWTLGPLALTLTEFRAETRLSVHSHASPYASLLIQGRYTEVSGDVPRLCDSTSISDHEQNGRNASHYFR